jgi:hypothetical protein
MCCAENGKNSELTVLMKRGNASEAACETPLRDDAFAQTNTVTKKAICMAVHARVESRAEQPTITIDCAIRCQATLKAAALADAPRNMETEK